MNRPIKKILALVSLAVICANVHAENSTTIIPAPVKAEVRDGQFQIIAASRIIAGSEFKNEAQLLAARLRPATGFKLKIKSATTKIANGDILLTTNGADISLGAEGYELSVTTNGVVIRATTSAGIFYGEQSLLQLLSTEIFSTNSVRDHSITWTIPCIEISDSPRFVWRGLMLDVSRHFFTKSEVEQLLDVMALHKINMFHWHLVDDNGWRIEIKKYPKLTSVGAWRNGVGFGLASNSTTAYGPDGRYGGFYTQADIREVVAYAAARHITIIPEIEMPGHSLAALAAYPQFGTGNGPFTVPLRGGVNPGIYSPAKEETFQFLDDVLTVVFQLFPSKYVHIGGDEVPKGPWKNDLACQALMQREGLKNEEELQSWFVRRIEKFINAHGKTMIGWSEILQGGLAKNAVVMDWIGGGKEAASEGHDVVMTPTSNCYFDFYQSHDREAEPRAIGGYLPLSKVYSLDPIPAGLTPEFQSHILGAQGNIWTEYIPNFKHVEYMAFPRLSALAEVTWSPKEARNFDDFTQRLKVDEQRLDEIGVNYRPYRSETKRQIGGWTPAQIKRQLTPLEWDVTKYVTTNGQCRVSLEYTDGDCGIDIAWVALLEDGQEISRDTHAGFTGSNPRNPIYTIDVPAPKSGAHYTLRAQVVGSDGTDSTGDVFWDLKPIFVKP